MDFQVGDRVQHIDTNNQHEPLNNQIGTVFHLHGEPGYKSSPSKVWVQWDTSWVNECWVQMSQLQKIEK